ncbi:MAG: SpoVR family protein [Patescibacteria group bacterium]|nr:SpoVR family protein [Patescibacteria group bacterium]
MIEEYVFPTELKLWKYEIERRALRYGLDLSPTVYTIVDFDEMSEIVATHGFPVVLPHWEHGQTAIHYKKRSRYGLGRVMEIVVNTLPVVHACLLRPNSLITNKSVMAHVTGHVDLYKRNAYFSPTNRNMHNVMADHRMLFERFVEEHGEEKVKQFYDTVLSFRWCIDAHAPYLRRRARPLSNAEQEIERREELVPKRIQVPEGLPESFDEWLNPPEWIEWQRTKITERKELERIIQKGLKIPPEPMFDLLEFLEYPAPLEPYERALIAIVRREAYYFAPQMRTKGLHEGWASLVEEDIMSEHGVLQDSEVLTYAEELAGVQRRHRGDLNPYRFFYELLRDVWRRWDTGRHGKVWEECEYESVKSRWDEFAICKNLLEEASGNMTTFAERWREFSAFKTALVRGELGFPKEFFIRNLYTSRELIPAWIRYANAEQEYTALKQRFKEMLPFEAIVSARLGEVLRTDEDATMQELRLSKVRRDVYEEAGRDDLYLWTLEEILRELKALETLRNFRERFEQGTVGRDAALPIPEDWFTFSRMVPGLIPVGKGREKVFEVCELYDDLMIIDEFFTPEFCLENNYFLYKAKPVWDWSKYPEVKQEHYFFENRSFERIKRSLLFRYTNFYAPRITVVNGNYNKNGELYLRHEHAGVDLDSWSENGMFMRDVLERLFKMWGGRSVHLETIKTKKPEERPWWFDWHSTQETTTDELEELTGEKVLYSWTPQGYQEKTLETIKFRAPF